MVGHAKSQAAKNEEHIRIHEDLMSRALGIYLHECERPKGQRRRGLRTICQDLEATYLEETGKKVKLCYMTLQRRVEGGKSRRDAMEDRAWLTPIETETVIQFIVELADRGWPLTHQRLKEHVDEILHARLGDDFPPGGVGKNWTYRFASKNSDRIRLSGSKTLEEKRAHGVNEHADQAYRELLGNTLIKYNISPENIYGADEIGIQTETGKEKDHVFGAVKRGPIYQQTRGSRENITVIVTICADGTAPPPAVIFKGKAYQVKWKQNNPANALIGYQKKGWTDGEIGVAWMEEFDKATRAKADGQHRLLLVDGHNSHYTIGFLRHARLNQIVVLCYPANSTHIYQGLDVVVFAVLKRCLQEERNKWLRKHPGKIDKKNFLEVYGNAHLRALKSETIKMAFSKTGVWPFNPNAILKDAFAPAKETSCEGHLPIVPPTPVKVIAKLLKDIDQFDPINEEREDNTPEEMEAQCAGMRNSFQDAIQKLAQTRLGYLLKDSPIKSSHPLPSMPHISLKPSETHWALSIRSETMNETLLLSAICELVREKHQLEEWIVELQAQNILNESYCTKLQFQLAFKEVEEEGGKKLKGKLMGDGLPKLLSGDEFYERVVEFIEWQKGKKDEKAGKSQVKKAYKKAKAQWDKGEEERKKKIEDQRAEFHAHLANWEAAKAVAKAAGKKFNEPKPKLGELPKAAEKPLLKAMQARIEQGDNDGEFFDFDVSDSSGNESGDSD